MRHSCIMGESHIRLLTVWQPSVRSTDTLQPVSAPLQHASVDGQCELPFAIPRRHTRMQLANVSYSRVPPSCIT